MLEALTSLLFPTQHTEHNELQNFIQQYSPSKAVYEHNPDLPNIHTIIAASSFRNADTLRHAIWRMKYIHAKKLCPQLATLLLPYIFLLMQQDTVLCPIPLYWKRRFDRGFNQSFELCRFASHTLSVPMTRYVKRVRNTGSQVSRNRRERFQAMEHAFQLAVKPKTSHVILVDDVYTTGSTVHKCATILKSEGVKRVDVVVLAHDAL